MKKPPYRTKNFMVGVIILWFGFTDNVPSGWHLCDGTMGTPNLMDRFVAGAGDTYAVGDTGGALNHRHNFTIGAHVAAGTDKTTYTNWKHNAPPYHALCYIMKVN